jgi:hypothetical protein
MTTTMLTADERTTRRLGVLSWALALLALLVLPQVAVLLRVVEYRDRASIVRFAIVFGVLFYGLLGAGLVLAVLSRRRSRTLHQGELAGHATVGFVLCLAFLAAYGGVVAAWLLWA